MGTHFSNRKKIKATKKRHVCGACNREIKPGEPAEKVAGRTYEGFYHYYLHEGSCDD